MCVSTPFIQTRTCQGHSFRSCILMLLCFSGLPQCEVVTRLVMSEITRSLRSSAQSPQRGQSACCMHACGSTMFVLNFVPTLQTEGHCRHVLKQAHRTKAGMASFCPLFWHAWPLRCALKRLFHTLANTREYAEVCSALHRRCPSLQGLGTGASSCPIVMEGNCATEPKVSTVLPLDVK
eukprot:2906697-Amphidinium_carterae.2